MGKKPTYAKKKISFDYIYFLSFFIPFMIMMVIFAIRDIFPFGEADRSFLHIDMYHQYFPFLTEFYHKVKNGESLFYSWNTGIGSNFLALYVYYLASPSNWLCLLVPERYLMEFISYMVVIKTGLCGLSFSYYLRRHFGTKDILCVLFSVFYALSGFMAAYNWNVMWLDIIVAAPVVILGLEMLVFEGKYRLYCLSLAFCIFSNYYLSIMLCIFLVLYFIVILIGRNPADKSDSRPMRAKFLNKIPEYSFYVKALIRFILFSLIAGGMAAILLFPELAAIKFTEFSDISFPKKIKTYFSVIDMLARHSFNVEVETGLDHWPNIYCGVAVYILLPLYAIQKKIPLRQKAPKLILLAFIMISFSTNLLNFLWHGLNYPDSLPARQSFLYIFLLLSVCYEEMLYIREHSGKDMISIFAGAICFILLCEKLITDDAFTGICFIATALLLIVYGCLIHIYRAGNSKRLFVIAAIVIVTLEAGINTYLTSCPTVSRDTYLSNYESYQTLTKRTLEKEQNSFFRFEKFARRTQNDAMLIGFPGASYFSSTINSLVSDFYEQYGMKGSRVNYCFDGATPVTAALLANKYMLYTLDRGYDSLFELCDTEGKLYMYRNNYSVPFGYMITESNYSEESDSVYEDIHAYIPDESSEESTDDGTAASGRINELFSDEDDIDEILTDDSIDDKNLNPLERQNKLVNKLGIQGKVFIPVKISSYGDEADLYPDTAAHYYAYSSNTKIDDIVMKADESSKTFSQIKKKYILDLGYHDEDDTVSLSSENGQDLKVKAYRVDETVLSEFINKLRGQTMVTDSYTATSIDAHITAKLPGRLVIPVAYEPGWTLTVDGIEEDMELFEDTFISVYLPSGEHSISLSYYPVGLNMGIIVTLISILSFILIDIHIRKIEQGR